MILNLRRRVEQEVPWPVLNLSSWAEYELTQGGEFLLAGRNVRDVTSWKATFRTFWDRYRAIDPHHPVFCTTGLDAGCVIPYMIHGDEGRGRNKLPLLTVSFQCLISQYGPHRLNMSGPAGSIE